MYMFLMILLMIVCTCLGSAAGALIAVSFLTHLANPTKRKE